VDAFDTAPLVEHHAHGTWTEVSVPHPGTSAALWAVTASSPDLVWAAGNATNTSGRATIPYADRWDGRHWVRQRLLAPDPQSTFVYGIAAAGSDDVWAVGSASDRALIEHRDASGWSVAATDPPHAAFYGVTATSASDVWAAGNRRDATGRTHPLIEHWNGRRWRIAAVPEPGDAVGVLFWGTTAVTADDVWAVGRYDAANGRERTLVEHWDGTSWSIVPSPSPNVGTDSFAQFYAVGASGPADAWAVGTYYDSTIGTNVALREHWNGSRWRVAAGPDEGTAILFGVAVGSPSHADAVGSSFVGSTEKVMRESWNGVRWRVT
jgi:hypothetical protein